MNREDLQLLAEERIGDAASLLQANRFSGAYYLSGLAVECAIKACIAKQTQRHEFPDLKRAKSSFQHDLEQLIRAGELSLPLEEEIRDSASFAANWNEVIDWQVDSRYETAVTKAKAAKMFLSVSQPIHGVLPWLRLLW